MSVQAIPFVAPACLQTPPGAAGSYGDDVCEIATRIGRAPEPEQKLAIDAMVAHDRRGRFLSVEAAVEGPRQSTGKTGAIMLPIILWTCLTDPDLVTWTSHLADTHIGSFHELAGKDPRDDSGLIAANDWLRARVRSISYENGAEGISWVNGAQLDMRCRSNRRGRGRSGSTVFSDEALFLDAASMGALLPTLSTRSLHGNARAYYASSAPMASSAFLWSLRRRALAGDPKLTYVGWWAAGDWDTPGCRLDGCSHGAGIEGCALDDPKLLETSNILLGRRTSAEFLASMRATFADNPREFGREFLGWGEPPPGDAVDPTIWRGLADPASTPEPTPVTIGLSVSPGGRSASVVCAGRRSDGLVHVELVAHRPGTTWLGEWLKDKQDALEEAPVHYRSGRTPDLANLADLEARNVQLEAVPETMFAAGCDELDRLIRRGGLRHLGDPRLTAALAAATRRDIGEGAWVLSWRGTNGDASAAMAMALAVHALAKIDDYDLLTGFG